MEPQEGHAEHLSSGDVTEFAANGSAYSVPRIRAQGSNPHDFVQLWSCQTTVEEIEPAFVLHFSRGID